ncbi:flagellar hook-length control protein FliK [Aliiglaciecola litoralis]|uniref:Flagellar hook-length control protein-like C-terminal domain-containing protein n=1 Tax=Aliiglaciecola litoralis TaxID=582857 RepID=A0ABP3WSQ5_9ALTE
MSDISLNTQQQLTQALAQLTRAQSTSPIAKQAAQVIIQHLAGNQISLGVNRQPASIQLPKPDKLPAGLVGTPVEAQLRAATDTSGKGLQQSILALFDRTSTSGTNLLVARLNQAQLSVLLDAVATKVEPESGTKSQIVNARVTAISGNTLSVSTQINGKAQQLSVIASPLPTGLKVGQRVQLQLIPQGNDWQVRLLTPSQLNPQNQSQSKSSSTAAPSLSATPVSLDKPQLVKLLPAQPDRVVSDNQANSISIPRYVLTETLSRQPALLPLLAQQKLAGIASHITQVKLVINQSGAGEIRAFSPEPAATLKLTPEQFKQVQSMLNGENTPRVKEGTAHRPSATHTVSQQNLEGKSVASTITQPNIGLSESVEAKIAAATPANKLAVADLPNAQKQVVQQQISDIIRRLMPQAGSPSDSLAQIEKGLADISLFKDPASKVIIEQLAKQLQQVSVQGKDADANQIKQLLTQAAQPITSVQLTQPVNQQQGLMSGLIALVQVVLAARLGRAQPQSSERLSQVMNTLTGVSNTAPTSQPQRSINEVHLLEQKHQLLKQLGRLFAQHQTAKLTSAEQMLQGQEALYYVLPSGTGDNRRDVELLIKRELEHKEQSTKKDSKNTIWHLTMKLDVGDIGQILSKATLRDMTLELDFYTSNETVKELVFNYLPLFKKRLESLGIEVAKTQCQLGKIPEQLHSRPYQMFETKA